MVIIGWCGFGGDPYFLLYTSSVFDIFSMNMYYFINRNKTTLKKMPMQESQIDITGVKRWTLEPGRSVMAYRKSHSRRIIADCKAEGIYFLAYFIPLIRCEQFCFLLYYMEVKKDIRN